MEKKEQMLQNTTNTTKSEHNDKIVTRMTFHTLDGFPIQKMASH